MEAAKQLYNVNLISEEKTVMEAHQRYLAIQKGQKDYYENKIAEIESELNETKTKLNEAKSELNETMSELNEAKSKLNETKSELDKSQKRESDKDRLIDELKGMLSESQN